MSNSPTSKNFIKWFDPRNKQPGSWAFILNRITALGLTLYLMMHLVVLGLLAKGPDAYDRFVEIAQTPFVKIGELLVISAVILHGLNGVRIGLTSFGIGVRYQRQILMAVTIISFGLIAGFLWVMFIAE